jgi:drug/metabolite transporter (DMT)-like permease
MLIYASVPPLTALIVRFVLDERLSAIGIVGMALTVAGIAIVVLRRPGQRPARTPLPDRSARADEPVERHPGLPVAPFADPVGEVSGYDAPDAGHASAPDKPAHHLRGALLAFGGALGQAVGLILGRVGAGTTLDAFAATQIRVFAGIVGFALVFTVTRRWRTIGPAVRDAGAMRRVALGALFGPFLGVSLGLYAAQNTSAGIASTIMALVPVLIIAPSVLLFGERVTAREVVGAVVAVGGVALLFL